MGFLKRFSNALFAPKEILNYRSDKWWMVTLIFFVLLLFTLIPTILSISDNASLDYEARTQIRQLFNGENDIPYSITNHVLVHDQNDRTHIYQKEVRPSIFILMTNAETVDESQLTSGIYIAFRTNGVYVMQSFVSYLLFTYQDYPEMNGIDFSDATSLSNNAFWDTMFTVFETEMQQFQPLLTTVSLLVHIISSAFSLIFISLILALFQSFQINRYLRFSSLWKLCLYLMTPYVFGNTLSLLFNFTLLYYVGFIVTAIYVIILGQTILRESLGGHSSL